MKKITAIIGTVFFLSSCGELIEPELNNSDQLVVVEGFLDATDSIHMVKISRTVGFSSRDLSPPITDAIVSLITSTNEELNLLHEGNGNYVGRSFALSSGINYQLQIELVDGSNLISEPEFVPAPAVIDSLHYDEIETRDPEDNQMIITQYFPIVFGTDRVDSKDFYVWKVYKNDTLFDAAEELILIEDRFFNGNNFRNDFTSFLFDLNDEIALEVSTFSENGFSYQDQLKEHMLSQNNNQPSNPNRLIGNIVNRSNPKEVILGNFSISNSKIFRKKIE